MASMGTGVMTPTTSAIFIPEIWDKQTQKLRNARLVMAGLVKRYDDRVKGGGDTIRIPLIQRLAAQQYTPGSDVTPQAPADDDTTIVVNQFWTSMFEIDRTLDTQSKYDLAEEYKDEAGYAIAKKIDTTLHALYAGLSNDVGDGTDGLEDTEIIAAIEKLDLADVPEENRYFVISPAGKADILGIDKFTLWQNRGKDVVGTGKYGEIYGVPVYTSSNVTKVTGTPDVYKNLMFHKDAFAMAMQKNITWSRVESSHRFADVYKPLAMWGVKELRDDHAVVVSSA